MFIQSLRWYAMKLIQLIFPKFPRNILIFASKLIKIGRGHEKSYLKPEKARRITNFNMSEKPFYRIEKDLLALEPVQLFLESREDIEMNSLLKISSDTVRIFYYKKIDGRKVLTSELINI